MTKIEINYDQEFGLRIMTTETWSDVNKSKLKDFADELASKPDVVKRIEVRGVHGDDVLREYLICFYGGNDNMLDADGNRLTSDYCHCGMRGFCADEGFPGLCSLPKINNVRISPSELENLRMTAEGKVAKEIAARRFRSVHTITTEQRMIRRKLAVKGIAAAVYKASRHGLIKTSGV